MIQSIIALIAIGLLIRMSVRANARFREEVRLPMQWALDGSVNWTAPRGLALALTPIDGLHDGAQAIPLLNQEGLVLSEVTIVNFWASWCGPCVEEHPFLIELSRMPGVRVVGVNYKDLGANARRFLGRYGNPFAAIGADTTGRAAIEWGVYGMPETFVLDHKGVIAYKLVGQITPQALRERLVPTIERLRGPQPNRRVN